VAAESVSVDQWIYALLSGDTPLTALISTRIYSEIAPETAIYPLVIYRATTMHDWLELGGVRGVVQPTYDVFAVDQTESYLVVKPIADRLDALLHRATGTADGVIIYQCLRQREHRTKGYTNGRGYCQLGGTYALQAR